MIKKSEKSEKGRIVVFFKVVQFFLFLYLFFIAINLMSDSFKLFGDDFARKLFTLTGTPLVSFAIGLLSTAIVQSSSSTTSMAVALVAGGLIPLRGAIFIIIGANIGTTVTSTLVSLAHIRQSKDFLNGFSAAIVHDFFNIFTAIIFLPLEIYLGLIEKSSRLLETMFSDMGGVHLSSPLNVIIKPMVQLLLKIFKNLISSKFVCGIVLFAIALIFLFFALNMMVRAMRRALSANIEKIIHQYIFKTRLRALMLGLVLTAIIQSSSVTTSLTVPLVAGGILTLNQAFSFDLGANIGTTITAILAALALAGSGKPTSHLAITLAFAHLLFNFFGTIIFFNFPNLVLRPVKKFAAFAVRNKVVIIFYILIIFYLLPFLELFLVQAVYF